MNAAALTRALGGQWHGNYGIARCVAHEDRAPSLSIRDGDAGVLWKCFSGCDWRDVLRELQRRGLVERRQHGERRIYRQRIKPRPQPVAAERLGLARWLWRQRQPVAGTPAETYLRARGYAGLLPETLGFVPARGGYPPAMIAAFGLADEPEPGRLCIADAAVRGVHLTRLLPDGSDRDRGDKGKIMVGRSTGNPIVLAPANDLLGLAITEGIEDALSVHAATGLGAWAAGTAGRMPALAEHIPSFIEAVTIAAHDDEAGRRGACALADALAHRGIAVRMQGLPT